eukprot:g6253.t1
MQDGIQDPNVLAAIVFGLVFVYFIWTWDNKRKRNRGSDGTCPAGFGSTKESNSTKNDVNEKDSSDDNTHNDMATTKNDQKGEKKFTLEELKKYKFKYVGVKGVVFDVSKNEMYNQGETYSVFTGHDASRALAKMSLEIADVENTNISDLSLSEIDTLDEWYVKFEGKYNRVGIVDFPKSAKRYPC